MELGLAGRRALITGASSGLGLSTAIALASEGAEVMLVARSPERLTAASTALSERVAGARVHVGTADVSDADQVQEIANFAIETMGGVDILIANAGGPPPGGFASTPLEAYLPALQLNLLSTVAMCNALVPGMCSAGWGRVVAITSITVREPNPNLILSNTARAGLTGFLRTLAREVAGNGVTVNSVQPGLHRTGRLEALYDDVESLGSTVPTGSIGDPDDFGRVATFLCSDSARFITGAAIPVDGGASHGLQ